MKIRIISSLIIILVIYLVIDFLVTGYIIHSYSNLDPFLIERSQYSPYPDILGKGELVKSGWINTREGAFYCRINALGSRNQFELSGVDGDIVVLLGDSMFFGYGLNDNETISYFLGEADSKRKYINLAMPGFNVCDSVEWYLAKRRYIKPPSLIIFEVLIKNDMYDARYVDRKMGEQIKRDYRFILYPFRWFITKERLLRLYLGRFEDKILGTSVSEGRFVEYFQNPLSKLKAEAEKEGTRVMVISYSCESQFIHYKERLKEYCQKNSIIFYELIDLVGEVGYKTCRLQSGHPSKALNKILAQRLYPKLVEAGVRME